MNRSEINRRHLAFEWLRDVATAEGAPELAGVALNAWHESMHRGDNLIDQLIEHPRWHLDCEVLKFGKPGHWRVWFLVGREPHDSVRTIGEGATPEEAMRAALAWFNEPLFGRRPRSDQHGTANSAADRA